MARKKDDYFPPQVLYPKMRKIQNVFPKTAMVIILSKYSIKLVRQSYILHGNYPAKFLMKYFLKLLPNMDLMTSIDL